MIFKHGLWEKHLDRCSCLSCKTNDLNPQFLAPPVLTTNECNTSFKHAYVISSNTGLRIDMGCTHLRKFSSRALFKRSAAPSWCAHSSFSSSNGLEASLDISFANSKLKIGNQGAYSHQGSSYEQRSWPCPHTTTGGSHILYEVPHTLREQIESCWYVVTDTVRALGVNEVACQDQGSVSPKRRRPSLNRFLSQTEHRRCFT